MNTRSITMEQADVQKLLGSASGDAALLYIYLQSGNGLETAEEALGLNRTRISCAAATLRQLGLWQSEQRAQLVPGERPQYSEKDILEADRDNSFKSLCGEVQRVLGRPLNTEELKILLSFTRYLGLPEEVISVLVCYCRDRARHRGSLRNPSLRTIEKEAYYWAEKGIDTVEEAAAFIHAQNVRYSRMSRLLEILQIRGRSLTAGEEKYALSWLEMDFEDAVFAMAYERTCLNTGGLSWAYMNKILTRWHEAGLHTAEQVKNGDRKPGTAQTQRQLDADEKAAIDRMMQGVK